MTQTNAGWCCSASPTAFTISMELNEIGGSLHGAPLSLQVDGRRLSPAHGSRVGKRPRSCSESPRQSRASSLPSPPQSRSSLWQLPQGKSSAHEMRLCSPPELDGAAVFSSPPLRGRWLRLRRAGFPLGMLPSGRKAQLWAE